MGARASRRRRRRRPEGDRSPGEQGPEALCPEGDRPLGEQGPEALCPEGDRPWVGGVVVKGGHFA